MLPDFYTPKFGRALRSYVNNGFFARGLDADDHAFIEQVRSRGIANGEVPNSSDTLFAEEMEYWTQPFSVDPHPTDQQAVAFAKVTLVIRKEHDDARRLLMRKKRENDKALMAAELEQAQRDYEKQRQEREQRLLRTMMDDLEWERANPRREAQQSDRAERSPRRRMRSRHYVPEWKLRELAAKNPPPPEPVKPAPVKPAPVMESETANLLHQARVLEAQIAEAQLEAERLVNQQFERDAKKRLSEAWRASDKLSWNARREVVAVVKLAQHETQIVREQRWRIHEQRFKAEQRLTENRNDSVRDRQKDTLKIIVAGILLKTFPKRWTSDEMRMATQVADLKMLIECCNEMLEAGCVQLGEHDAEI